MKRATFLFVALFFIQFSSDVLAKDTRYEFMLICKPVLDEFQKDFGANKKRLSDEQLEKHNEQQRKIFSDVKSKLKLFVKDSPSTIWSDDAQNVIVILSQENIEEQTLELERLITLYPDANMEDWSKKAFYVFLSDKYSVDSSARLNLCDNYRQLGKKEKFEKLLDESLKKYPDNKLFILYKQAPALKNQ